MEGHTHDEMFHIHIYKITGLSELNIKADSIEKAQEQALKQAKAKELPFDSKPDCEFIALAYHGAYDKNKQ